jgi:hypothetical protein
VKYDPKEISEGMHDGKVVWICHYNRPDLDKKPLRCVKPTLVKIVPNSELPENKSIYYSTSHFVPVGKNNKLLKKVIPLYDNTGYRFITGNPLLVFDGKLECKKSWNEQIGDCYLRIQERIKNATGEWVAEQKRILAMTESTD